MSHALDRHIRNEESREKDAERRQKEATMKFRKKPVVIEAIQFTDESKDQCYHFVTCNRYASFDCNEDAKKDKPTLIIETLEGSMKAELGDWIIKGVKGEFYPCKPDIFVATYEAVPE